MDEAAGYLGSRHRLIGHNLKMLRAMEDIFGKPGRIIAAIHIMQDMGLLDVRQPRKRQRG